MSWRVPFIFLACVSFAFAIISVLWLTPSPRWLTLHGRSAEATATWDLLGVSHAEREKVETEQIRESFPLASHQDPRASPVTEIGGGIIATDQRSTEKGKATTVTEASDLQEPSLKSSGKANIWDLFSRDTRTRTALALFMMGMQQLSGIDGVLYVSCPTSSSSLF